MFLFINRVEADDYVAVIIVVCGCDGDRVPHEESSEPHCLSSNSSSHNHSS